MATASPLVCFSPSAIAIPIPPLRGGVLIMMISPGWWGVFFAWDSVLSSQWSRTTMISVRISSCLVMLRISVRVV